MIRTRQNDLLRIVLNEVEAQLSLEELGASAGATAELTEQGYRVIWDLRKLRVASCDCDMLHAIQRGLSAMEREQMPQKRAIVVGTTVDRELLEGVLGGASIVWPWGIFLDFGKALQWVDGG